MPNRIKQTDTLGSLHSVNPTCCSNGQPSGCKYWILDLGTDKYDRNNGLGEEGCLFVLGLFSSHRILVGCLLFSFSLCLYSPLPLDPNQKVQSITERTCMGKAAVMK